MFVSRSFPVRDEVWSVECNLREQIRGTAFAVKHLEERELRTKKRVVDEINTLDVSRAQAYLDGLKLCPADLEECLMYAVLQNYRASARVLINYGVQGAGKAIITALELRNFMLAYDILHSASGYTSEEISSVRALKFNDIADEMVLNQVHKVEKCL